MHFMGIGSVVIDNVSGYSFAKVRFEAVHTHIQELLELAAVPAAGFRIRKVHYGHTRLPHIPLPHIPVFPFEEIAVFHALIEQMGLLSDIGINPDTGPNTQVFNFLQQFPGI